MARQWSRVLSIGLGLIAACGGSADQADEPDVQSGDAAAEQRTSLRDACEVLTVADVQPYFPEPLEARPGTRGSSETTCEYWGSDFRAGFSVTWTGGKEEFEMYNSATDLAATMLAEPGVNVDSIVKPGAVAGLGDAATFSDLMPSFVLVGDQLLQFQIMNVPGAGAAFVPLARKAIGRL
jgi:hypothetical protein